MFQDEPNQGEKNVERKKEQVGARGSLFRIQE